MNPAGLDRFVQGHLGKNARQSLSEHRLAGTRGPHEEHIVSAGGSNFQRTLCMLLASHLPKVKAACPWTGKRRARFHSGKRLTTGKKFDDLRNR